MEDLKTIKNLLVFFAVVLLFYLLKELAAILLPFILALLIALIVQPLIIFLNERKIPNWLVFPFVTIISLSVLLFIALIIADTASQIYYQRDFLLAKLLSKTDYLLILVNNTFHLKLDTTLVVSEIYQSIDSGALKTILASLAGGLGSLFSSAIFFSLYYIMLLAGMTKYKEFLSYVGATKKDSVISEYEHLQKSVYSYMVIKTLINLGIGLVTILLCWLFGIKFAIFWGFIAFIFHYIPNFGAIAGVALPSLMAFIQLDNLENFILFVLILAVVHFSTGNIIEPIIMGNKLRLNTIFVLLGLVFWGYIWGIPGMILSVPLLVIIKIILEKSQEFSIFGRLMGYPDK
ncbi:MAG TPA: AI-2E family transporter [Candidatus Kapabacteria bacterium]|nr:AI-2E family transporter [Candidatus Kapabacteria bacterium]